jgi:hypothetical protein
MGWRERDQTQHSLSSERCLLCGGLGSRIPSQGIMAGASLSLCLYTVESSEVLRASFSLSLPCLSVCDMSLFFQPCVYPLCFCAIWHLVQQSGWTRLAGHPTKEPRGALDGPGPVPTSLFCGPNIHVNSEGRDLASKFLCTLSFF